MAASEIDQHAATKIGFMTSFNSFQEGWVSTFNCMNGKMLNFFLRRSKRALQNGVQDPPIAYGLSSLLHDRLIILTLRANSTVLLCKRD